MSGKFESKFENGKRYGKWVRYHKNGQLRSVGTFKDGQGDGLLEYFNKDGFLKSSEIYKNGKFLETIFP